MSVLAMRPISTFSDNDLEEWGNESIAVLANFYGTEQTHTFNDPETKTQQTSRSQPQLDRLKLKVSTYAQDFIFCRKKEQILELVSRQNPILEIN